MASLTEGKQFEAAKWVLLIVAVFVLLRILGKMGLLGKDQAQQASDKLGQSAGLTKPVQQQSEMQKAIRRKLGTSKPTKQQLLTLVPNYSNFGSWVVDIENAKHFTGNDIEGVMGIFRNMNSQFEINMFAQTFQQTTKKDLFGWLKKLFTGVFGNAERMQDIYNIIKDKPLV